MESGWHKYYELGKKAFEEERYEEALANFAKVPADAGYADLYNMLGLIYYHSGRHSESIEAFRRALKINPRYTDASLNLSVVYNELGRLDESSRIYAGAKETLRDEKDYLDPYVKGKLANKHAELGNVYRDLCIYDEAAYEYRKALMLRPEFIDIKTELGAAYRGMKAYKESVMELKEAVLKRPDYMPARIQLGLTYYTMGELQQAKAEWTIALEAAPANRLAKMYMKLVEGK